MYSYLTLILADYFPNGSILLLTLLIIGIFLGDFLIIRAIVLWYWKIDVIVSNQEAQTELVQRQNELISQQTEILNELRKQLEGKQINHNNETLAR